MLFSRRFTQYSAFRLAAVHLIFVAMIADRCVSAANAQDHPAAEKHRLDIRLDRNADWAASLSDVQKVLDSAAMTLWPHFPERTLKPILVSPQGGPKVLFKRSERGEYQVRLSTGGRYWSQYAFQFAHEFCHILCNYDRDVHRNKWFEESICETASLFALRRMAHSWQTKPPYPNWKNYSKSLAKYADERIDKGKLPEGTTLARWYRDNAGELSRNGTDRAKNNVVAGVLLEMFEAAPEHWEAVTYLNAAKLDKSQSFQQYLEAWRSNAPEKHHKFIEQVAGKFGVELPISQSRRDDIE